MTWEYRCVKFPTPSDFRLDIPFKTQYADLPSKHTDLLNELGADGWEWFHANGDLFYFRREVKEQDYSHLTLHAWAERMNEGNESRTVEETEQTLAEFIRMQDR